MCCFDIYNLDLKSVAWLSTINVDWTVDLVELVEDERCDVRGRGGSSDLSV